MKTVAIFAHYDTDNQINPSVVYYLQQLQTICGELVFVSTSNLSSNEFDKIDHIASKIILRENIGHDFYSYKVGLAAVENLKQLDQLILCNDSCFGPLFNLSDIYRKLTNQKGDFFGMSANCRPFFHLQSYFLVFNQRVIQSEPFLQFWQNLTVLTNKDQIVRDYEVGLSQILIKAGYQAISYLSLEKYQISQFNLLKRKFKIFFGELLNPNSRYSWKNLFEPLSRIDKTISLYDYSTTTYKFPFLKKSLLMDKWTSKEDIYRLIDQNTEYDSSFIRNI